MPPSLTCLAQGGVLLVSTLGLNLNVSPSNRHSKSCNFNFSSIFLLLFTLPYQIWALLVLWLLTLLLFYHWLLLVEVFSLLEYMHHEDSAGSLLLTLLTEVSIQRMLLSWPIVARPERAAGGTQRLSVSCYLQVFAWLAHAGFWVWSRSLETFSNFLVETSHLWSAS